ncbi:hypothetical protein GCM10023149_02240 [Mucilaginibacter gynuensis]|uniref:Lipoprotein n=2 Tax=Mucilaginibacter gynuensis TaxID=1302236 RepID=A0ABP8FPW5_9SPHI
MLLSGCKKDKKADPKPDEPAEEFTKEILNIIPKHTIDSLRSFGMVINEGTTPPNLEGSYYTNDSNCFFDNSNFVKIGKWRGNYTYKFYNQKNEDLTIDIDYEIDGRTDVANGVGSFISGNGNKFSAFFVTKGIARGINYKSLTIISGTKTAEGITNWTDCLRITEKDADPTNILINVSGTRIFKEDDELATFAFGNQQKTLSIKHFKSGLSR